MIPRLRLSIYLSHAMTSPTLVGGKKTLLHSSISDLKLTLMNSPVPYVIVLDDHPLVGHGMAQFLQSITPHLPVSVVSDWAGLTQLRLEKGCPMVLVADVWLTQGHCLTQLTQWCEECPSSPWMAVSGDDDPAIACRVRAAGARAFVHKRAPPERLASALEAVLAGDESFDPAQVPLGDIPQKIWPLRPQELGLTARQGAIFQRMLRGLPNKRIGADLGITESTVKEHVTSILSKLGVRNRAEAIAAMRGRQLDLP
jgi:DNA-binding NarL/FixJ family response regulator